MAFLKPLFRHFKARRWALFSLLVILPIGFLCKFYSGPAESWVNDSAAGIPYVIFWCLFIYLFWPGEPNITAIAVGVLLVNSFLEFIQLWHPPLLESIRTTFIGRTLIGSTFAPSDFIYYVIGCTIAWFWMRLLVRAENGDEMGPEPA